MARQRLHLVGQLSRPGKRTESVELVVDNPEDVLVYTSDALNRVYERIESGKAYFASPSSGNETITLENPSDSGIKAVVYAVNIITTSTTSLVTYTYGYHNAAGTTALTEVNLLTGLADAVCNAASESTTGSINTAIASIRVPPNRLTSSTQGAVSDSVVLASPVGIAEGDFFRIITDESGGDLGVYWYEI